MTKPLFLIFKVMRNFHVNVLYCELETKKFVLKTITTNEVSTTEKNNSQSGFLCVNWNATTCDIYWPIYPPIVNNNNYY